MKKVRLSKLSNEARVGIENSGIIYTVKELKEEIAKSESVYRSLPWQVAEPRRWTPNADTMVRSYIDHEYKNMSDDWDERATQAFSDDIINEMQAVLEKVFKDEDLKVHWHFDSHVIID